MPDILPAFFRLIGAPLPPRYKTLPFLFPRAILEPGMRHSVDRMIKKGLNSLEWFPSFLDGLKAVNSFVGDRRKDLMISLRKSGHGAVADLAHTAKNPPFAKWRWGTLWMVVQENSKYVISLAATACLEPFRKRAQDPSLIRRVQKAFADPEWFCPPLLTITQLKILP